MTKNKRTLCIVTADRILAYQPSILNLYDFLRTDFDVEIISLKPAHVAKGIDIIDRKVHYIDTETRTNKVLTFLQYAFNFLIKRFSKHVSFIRFRFHFSKTYELGRIKKFLKPKNYDTYIGVDSYGFYPLQRLQRKGYFFSLELSPTDPYINKIDKTFIEGVVIQSKARLDYLFPETKLPVFYIQNAPVFRDIEPPNIRTNLIWAGSILKEFGVFDLLNFLEANQQFKLTMKGGTIPSVKQEIDRRYQQLIEDGRIVFDTKYVADADFYEYLSQYRIGFCFYDWDLIRSNYNYYTAPSGKLYAYYVAGVPVIAPDIEGMSSVHDFGTGVLIANYKPETIKAAIEQIEHNYSLYVENCKKAAKHFSFTKMAKPFLQYLLNTRHTGLS